VVEGKSESNSFRYTTGADKELANSIAFAWEHAELHPAVVGRDGEILARFQPLSATAIWLAESDHFIVAGLHHRACAKVRPLNTYESPKRRHAHPLSRGISDGPNCHGCRR